jgi:hypothetical protein
MTNNDLARTEKEGLHLVVDEASQTLNFPQEVGPEVKDAVTLYNGKRISATDAVWLPGCYKSVDHSKYEDNVQIV